MPKITLNVTADISSMLNIQRYAEKNRPTLVRTAANRYLQFLRNRYVSLSAGSSGQWAPLELSTILRRIRRKKQDSRIKNDPDSILREYDIVLKSMGVKTNGQITYVGFVENRRHPRGATVWTIVVIQTGMGRRIIVMPSEPVKKRMVDDIRKDYNKIIRVQKRGK